VRSFVGLLGIDYLCTKIRIMNHQRQQPILRFVDLFAGIGGIRKGLELAAAECGIATKCVFTSEVKPYAVSVLKQNHPDEVVHGDITEVDAAAIPDFDILCAGFPCQAFSRAGMRHGFADTRGTMFFEVERILKEKQPLGFVLENVDDLAIHDKGETLRVIISHLESLGYKVTSRVLDSRFFGVPQSRCRIYIVGSRKNKVDLDNFPVRESVMADVLDKGLPTMNTKFVQLLLDRYCLEELYGKRISDKRAGCSIHSWDINLKGYTSDAECALMNLMLQQRRLHKWSEAYGIDYMDGVPLTTQMIRSFFPHVDLENMLERLTKMGYLSLEYPKKKMKCKNKQGHMVPVRVPDESLEKGYNIVTGQMSFPINRILGPYSISPTLVAMDMERLGVVDGEGIRRLTLREGLRLCGYPEDFKFDNITLSQGYNLIGNTVVVPVIQAVAKRLLEAI
jgi:DNA (cytosine-5)-methyltransferase 1